MTHQLAVREPLKPHASQQRQEQWFRAGPTDLSDHARQVHAG